MKTLHVIPNAQVCSATRELDLLLATQTDEQRISCLGEDGPASASWRVAGHPVEVLHWKRWLDPRPLWALGRYVREMQPDLIAAWGLMALRAVVLAAPKTRATIALRRPIASQLRRPCTHRLSALDRWLVRRADRVLASSRAEAEECVRHGVGEEKIRVVPPGVRAMRETREPDKPIVLCVGELLPHKGFYDAIWAFDILHFPHREVELAIVGDGTDRRRLEGLRLVMGEPQRMHLVAATPDVESWLARASVVWTPSLTDSGATTVLEAMAAGKPVIAYRRPGLAEHIVDGETGFLVEPGNQMDLAKRTMQLLTDRSLRQRMGEAGRRRVRNLYSPQRFVDAWSRALGLEYAVQPRLLSA